MKSIQILVDQIEDELCSAKDYAEKSLALRVEKSEWSAKFKAIAMQELEHSEILHQYTVQEITKIRELYTPPEKMLEKWDKAHKHYIEKSAWIRQMLAM